MHKTNNFFCPLSLWVLNQESCTRVEPQRLLMHLTVGLCIPLEISF